jgi:hypothetical protein
MVPVHVPWYGSAGEGDDEQAAVTATSVNADR